jgi:hypothetical protein
MGMERRFFVGLDLGQAQDYSALSVVELVHIPGEWDAVMFARKTSTALQLRHVERIRLGTPYPDIVTRAGAVTRSAELAGRCQLMVDASGCGRPVVDLLRRARVECPILPVTITAGGAETYANSYYHVPKKDLIAGVQVGLQNGRLRIAKGMRYGEALREELFGMQARLSGTGHRSFGAARSGTHDDLIMALALSLWGMQKVYPGGLSGGLSGSLSGARGPGWRGGG